MLMEGRNIYL